MADLVALATAVDALARERLASARRMHVLRFGGVSAFFALYVVLGGLLGLRAWQGNLRLFAIYWLVSGALWLAARRADRVAIAGGLAIALVDMPAVFFVQLATFPTSNTVTGVAGFTAGVYVFLVFLGGLSLARWQIALTALSAAFWEGLLQREAGVVPEAIAASAILMGLAGVTCAYAGGRLVSLVAAASTRGLERLRAEEALAQSERSFRLLIEGSPDATAVVRNGVFVYVNHALVERLGYSDVAELVGRRYGDFVDSQDRGETQLRLRAAATGARTRVSDERFLRKDGAQVVLETAALRVAFEGVPSVMVVGRDVTERKRLEAEIARAREARARVDKLAAVGNLAAGVAHDLRNPLSAVRHAVHWLDKRVRKSDLAIEPRAMQALDIVEKELRACSGIVDELLDFARERPLDRREVALVALVADAASIARLPPHVTLIQEVPPDLPLLSIDPAQFRQVLVNLVQNAAEAIPATRAGHVWVRARLAGREVALEVSDDGVGIPAENLAQIFEPLFTTRSQGTGLGLAIVATIVRRHGGEIAVASKIEQGTTFTIRISLEPRTS